MTLIILFNNIIKYIISIMAFLFILDIYGVNTTSLVAGLGVIGLLVGLSLQDALKDIIAGINIIMDNYYVVGDKIKYKDFTGNVISFGLKTTKIKSLTGEVLIVTNRNIDSIINLSQKETIIPFQVMVSSDTDTKLIKQAIEEIINNVSKHSYVNLKESIYLGIEKITGLNTTYSFQIRCQQGKEDNLKREIFENIKTTFLKYKISIVG
ncbi:MAG: mechanosensitive ion channel [Bacilli bacterium]|nr:mechanosensitive ion channel [Bacilli bacterium]